MNKTHPCISSSYRGGKAKSKFSATILTPGISEPRPDSSRGASPKNGFCHTVALVFMADRSLASKFCNSQGSHLNPSGLRRL